MLLNDIQNKSSINIENREDLKFNLQDEYVIDYDENKYTKEIENLHNDTIKVLEFMSNENIQNNKVDSREIYTVKLKIFENEINNKVLVEKSINFKLMRKIYKNFYIRMTIILHNL